jgi:tetratricopeptide (TPR) repeat protein
MILKTGLPAETFVAQCAAAAMLIVLGFGQGCAPKHVPVSREVAIEHHLERGSRLLAASVYPSAIKEFEQVIAMDPDNLDGHLGLGLTYLHTTYYQGALSEFSRALELDDDSAEGHYGYGAAEFQLGDMAEAEVHFETAVALQPDYALALYSLGVISEKKGEDAMAQNYYEAAVASDPALTQAHYNLAILYEKTNRPNKAIDELLEVKSLAPDLLAARLVLGEAYRLTGQYPASLGELDYANKLEPRDPKVHYQRGMTLLAMDKLDEAITSFTKALALDPNYFDCLLALADVETRQGDLSRAELDLQRAVEADSTSVQARYRLGMALAAQDRNAEALDQLRHAIRLGPDAETAEKIQSLIEELRQRGQGHP